MDLSIKTSILVFMMACVSCVPGQTLPAPKDLQVKVLDGVVTVHWDKPADAPLDVRYNVQFGLHSGNWTTVNQCSNITLRICDLSHLIKDYIETYKVRVQMEANGTQSEWTHKKKILPNTSDLSPPSFSMWATSSTLTIRIHQKPILRELFPFGTTYTIYLLEKEQNKSTTAYLEGDVWDNDWIQVFSSLRWGKEYCVTVKVEGNGAVVSSPSTQQCLVLPDKEWILIAVASLTVVGVLIIAAFILCYVKPPVKTPVALKSPASEWRPLSIVEGPLEVVTDKGWFLFSAGTEVKHLPTTHITDEKCGEEDRRPSTDSGVSMKSTSDNTGREDSGCGSIGVQDAICIYPIQDEGSDTLSTVKSDDSGVELNCHSDASSLNLEDQDSGCLNRSGEFHNQRMLIVNIHDSDNHIFKEKRPEPQISSVVSGYRTNTSICTCSGANLCIWCRNQNNYKEQCKGLLQKDNTVESYRHYSPKVQMDGIETNLTLIQMEKTFPMLTSLSSFPLMEKEQDFNMNDVSISLFDVEFNVH